MSNGTMIGEATPKAAREVRRRLREAGVLGVSIIGGGGAGKTALLGRTLSRLRRDVKAGVIVGNLKAERDVARLQALAQFVRPVRAGGLHVQRRGTTDGALPGLSPMPVYEAV